MGCNMRNISGGASMRSIIPKCAWGMFSSISVEYFALKQSPFFHLMTTHGSMFCPQAQGTCPVTKEEGEPKGEAQLSHERGGGGERETVST